MKTKLDILLSDEIKAFIDDCKTYVDGIARCLDRTPETFWNRRLPLLARIYQACTSLPTIEVRYNGDVEKFVTEAEYDRIHKDLKKLFGQVDTFPDISDLSHPGAMKVTNISIAEVLSDLYQELKDIMMLYKTGTVENMNDAIAECLDTFENYWGIKLLSVMRIGHIHQYQYRYATANKQSILDVDINDMIDDDTNYALSDED